MTAFSSFSTPDLKKMKASLEISIDIFKIMPELNIHPDTKETLKNYISRLRELEKAIDDELGKRTN